DADDHFEEPIDRPCEPVVILPPHATPELVVVAASPRRQPAERTFKDTGPDHVRRPGRIAARIAVPIAVRPRPPAGRRRPAADAFGSTGSVPPFAARRARSGCRGRALPASRRVGPGQCAIPRPTASARR